LFDDIVSQTETKRGDVLIFFSGSREILECVDAINRHARSESHPVVAYPLYSSMDEESKSAAKDPAHRTGLDNEFKLLQSDYVRKVICCTNIAEVSREFSSRSQIHWCTSKNSEMVPREKTSLTIGELYALSCRLGILYP
jgi:hypothetical protein